MPCNMSRDITATYISVIWCVIYGGAWIGNAFVVDTIYRTCLWERHLRLRDGTDLSFAAHVIASATDLVLLVTITINGFGDLNEWCC